MSSVRFMNGTVAKIEAAPYIDGNVYCATDNDLLAYDLKGERHWIEDVLYRSTANWVTELDFDPTQGQLIVYSDYMTDEDNNQIPGIKIGDGTTPGVELPFITTIYDQLLDDFNEHIKNTSLHFTLSEKEFLTKFAVACSYEAENEQLIFTTFSQAK